MASRNCDHRVACPARVALATSQPLEQDERSLISAMQRLGIRAEPVLWSDPNADWSNFQAVVIRSCWDYHHRVAEFLDWAHRVEESGVTLINDVGLVRWNSSKHYLLDLAGRGTTVPPTVIVRSPATRAKIRAACEQLPSSRHLVVKPAVSASAYRTWRLDTPLSPDDEDRINAIGISSDLVVQPFIEAVVTHGEMSLIFIDGTLSHAVNKRAAAGDFRVQSEHGGVVEPVEPPPNAVKQAAAILAMLPGTPTYARVDGVFTLDTLTLMELELIEPQLFLSSSPGAAARLAEAIARKIRC